MVEHRGLGRACGSGVVVRADRVQELGSDACLERRSALLDQAQAEVNVPEQAPLVRGTEDRPASQLDRAADVVQERGREQEIGAQSRMELRDLAADRRDADGVLQEPAGVAVVAFDRRGKRAEPSTEVVVADEAPDRRLEAGVRDLAGEELEKAFELVGIAAHRGRELGRVQAFGGLERADLELQAVAEAIDSSQHAYRVALGEAAVQEVDVAPHAAFDAPARVDELDGEVRRTCLRAEPLLLRDRVNALDDPVLLELCDRGHESSLGPQTDATVRPPWPSSSRFARFATTPSEPVRSRISSRRRTT